MPVIRRKFRNNFRLFMIVIILITVVSCKNEIGNVDHSVAFREVTDDLNRTVKLPGKVTKAVSLAPNLTEIIFAVGGGGKLVGVTTFCNYPVAATKIQKIGDTLKPNIETIIALKPDVVFVSTASQLESFTETIEKQGIAVFVTNPSSLKGIYESAKKVGEVFGQETRSEKLIKDMNSRVGEVEKKTKNLEKIKTFVQIDKSLFTIGTESFLTDLIEKAGGISITRNVETAYPKISKEKALALNPDAIILSDSVDNDEPNPVFENSNAVRNKRVYKINADILSRPGPRIVNALEQIARSLHPEKFD